MERSRAKTEKSLEGNFPSLKNKKIHPEKFLIFREMELSSPKLKKLLSFQERTCKARKSKFKTFSFLRENFLIITAKQKKFLIFSFIKKQNFQMKILSYNYNKAFLLIL